MASIRWVLRTAGRERWLRALLLLSVLAMIATLAAASLEKGSWQGVQQAIVMPWMVLISAAFVYSLFSIRNGAWLRTAAAACVGLFVSQSLIRDQYWAENPIKYGVGSSIVLIAVIVMATVSRAGKIGAVLFVLATASIVGLLYDARLILWIVLVSCICSIPRIADRLWKIFTLAAGSALLLFAAMQFVSTSNLISSGQALRWQMQMRDGPVAFAVRARPEFFSNMAYIAENPLLGVGSSENVTRREAFSAVATLRNFLPLDASIIDYLTTGDLKSHSIVLQQWITGGVLGALPWIFISILLIRSVMRSSVDPQTSLLVNTFCFLALAQIFVAPWTPVAEPLIGTALGLSQYLTRRCSGTGEASETS